MVFGERKNKRQKPIQDVRIRNEASPESARTVIQPDGHFIHPVIHTNLWKWERRGSWSGSHKVLSNFVQGWWWWFDLLHVWQVKLMQLMIMWTSINDTYNCDKQRQQQPLFIDTTISLYALQLQLQSFKPINRIHCHLCAFHFYAYDMSRQVEAHHYCMHYN